MVKFMRLVLFFLFVVSSFCSFSQRKSKQGAIPETQKDSLMVEGLLIEAEKYVILENYARALENLQSALEMNAESAAINYKISEVLAKNDEGQKALPYGLRAIDLEPNNKYYRLGLARIYTSIGFYIDAAKTYEEALKKFPTDENALYELAELYQLTGRRDDMFRVFDLIEKELGVKEEIVREKQRILMKEGKVDLVIAEYRKLSNAYPNEPSFKVELISFLIQNRRLEEAEKEIQAYEASESLTSRVKLLKSELAWMRNNRKRSLELLSEAFETSSIDFETKFQIVTNYLVMASTEEDQKALTSITLKLAEKYPDEYKAQGFAGDLLFQQGRGEEAISYYLKAVNQKPGNFSVWQNILNIEANLQMYDSLVVHAERALEYFPNQALLYYFAGTGYMIKEDYNRSIRTLEQGKKYTIDPDLLTVFYGQLGDAYNETGNSEKSYQAYDKALENQPNNDHVLNNYSYFLSLENKQMDKALQMSKLLIELQPENPTYLDTRGWVLYVVGDYKEARKYLEKAVSLDKDGTVLEHYGDVLFQLGEVDQAIRQWELAKQAGGASEQIDKKIAEKKLYE